MPRQRLNDAADVVIRLKKMGGEGVAERVGSNAFRYPRTADGMIKSVLELSLMEMITPPLTGLSHYGQRLLREN